MAAPAAINVAEPEAQMLAEFMVMEGFERTVTVAGTGVAEQDAMLPLKVYTIVLKGFAITVFPVPDDKVDALAQV